MNLMKLVSDAVKLGGGELCCVAGHQWVPVGGRECFNSSHVDCSQPVFQCKICNEYDYGENDGPGNKFCIKECEHRKNNL